MLFIFLDPGSTVGTATAVPYSQYTCSMVWGGLLGGVLTSLKQLHQNRNNDDGGKFAWRVAVVCLVMFFLIRTSLGVRGHYYGVGNDTASVGPLTLIIVLVYLWDRRAWMCFGGMLVIQFCLSLYVIARPDSVLNGFLVKIEDAGEVERNLSGFLRESEVVGARVPGQFMSTISMAVHAAVGIAAGLALLIGTLGQAAAKKVVSVTAGVALILVGSYLLGVSASRGVMIGLAFGILVYFLNAQGPMRFIMLGIGLCGILIVGTQLVDMIPEDDPLWGRFVQLRNYQITEDYRIAAMRNGVGAIMASPLLGWGDFDSALEATDGYMPHIGPYSMAVIHGVPGGLLACLILAWAGMGDLTGKNSKELKNAPELRPFCAFATMSCWIALVAIMTNGYTPTAFIYILLGIAMWPMIYQPPLEEPTSESTADEGVDSIEDSTVSSDDSATVRT